MIKNIFITGKPGVGKTTLIKEILRKLKIEARGFFTQEIREKGERVGFKIVTLTGKRGILAKKGLKTIYQVSKYGVLLNDLEKIGLKEIEEAIGKNFLIVIDEVGKMELFSQKFKKVILAALNSENKVLGTIMLKKDPFADQIKKRKDTKVFYLKKENREKIKREIIQWLEST